MMNQKHTVFHDDIPLRNEGGTKESSESRVLENNIGVLALDIDIMRTQATETRTSN
jgi:hypothetical protein